MVFAPPQHGKSELVSRRLPAYILGRKPDASIIACSYAFDLAGRMNRDTQRIIDDTAYERLFPDTRLWGKNNRIRIHGHYLRNSDLFEVVNRRGVYRAAGVGGGITGMGANFGLIDDPIKDDEEAYSATVRAKLIDWYRGTFYTRLRKNASVLLTMTRWHRGDLAGVLLKEAAENPKADQWTVVSFEATRTDADSPGDPRQPGQPLWTEFKSSDDLDKIRATLGPTKYAAMYQQSPRREGGAEWPEHCFTPDIWFTEWPQDIILKAVAWDPSKGRGSKWGDYSAFVKVALCRDGRLYVDADMANDRSTAVMIDLAVEIQRTFQPDAFGIETNQFQELLVGEVNRASAVAGVPIPIWEINNQINKEIRIRRLTHWLVGHKIRFKGGSAGARMLVEQLEEFPNADHDDGPDALEMADRLITTLTSQVDDGLGNNLLSAGRM